MRNFTVSVDEIPNVRNQDMPSYMIALAPSSESCGAMSTQPYATKEPFAFDLQRRLHYTPEAVERFFASKDKRQTLFNYGLSDEDSFSLGWLPDFDRRKKA